MKEFIQIHRDDNVAIALVDLKKGYSFSVNDKEIILIEDVGKGHKISLDHMLKDTNIIKYGMPIGHLLADVKSGQWLHVHNLKTNLKDLNEYTYVENFKAFNVDIPEKKVMVFKRKNGEVGIRNDLWIIPTVGCVNGIGTLIKEEFLRLNPSVDKSLITVLTHNYGCSQLGEDHENTKTILQNTAKHPNAGGVLVLGLGCENNQLGVFKDTLGDYDENRIHFLISQDHDDEISQGVKELTALYENMQKDKREQVSIGKLKFGLECGGSDGFSGITANPMLGEFSDYIIQNGGISVLTEVPEMFGAETLLMERCKDKATFNKTVDLINDFKSYFIKHDQEIYENPSPGNKKGGITTLEDKSLGCTQKSGLSKVNDVLKYGETLKTAGLNLLSAPGNDAVATTALASTGCHMVLFTTGRGNPYGGYVPTVKIATNSDLATRKTRWIDFNAGRLVSEDISMDDLLAEFIDYIVTVANGQPTNNEKNNFKEIAIFKSGVTL